MIVLVNDASILIDLLKADLIEPFFQLDCEFHVTDFAAGEVQEENADQLEAFVQDERLIKKAFDFEALLEIQRLETAYKALMNCAILLSFFIPFNSNQITSFQPNRLTRRNSRRVSCIFTGLLSGKVKPHESERKLR